MANLRRIRIGVAGSLVFLALAGCSGGNRTSSTPRSVFPQSPEPSPIPSTTPRPTPTPEPSPVPSPSPSPSPSPTPVACNSSLLAPWNHWSIFAAESAWLRGMDVAEGVAGKQLVLDGVDLGYALGRSVGRYDLVAETLEFGWTRVNSGSAAYQTKVKFRERVDVYGGTRKHAAIDFGVAFDQLIDLQFHLLDMKTNGETRVECVRAGQDCDLTLVGSDPRVNRFTVSEAQLKGLRTISVKVPKKATAVVLIEAKNVSWKDLEIDAPYETVWTLGQPHGKFRIDFMSLPGTVLLVSSTFEVDQALVMGRVLSQKFVSATCHSDRACATVDSQALPEKICL